MLTALAVPVGYTVSRRKPENYFCDIPPHKEGEEGRGQSVHGGGGKIQNVDEVVCATYFEPQTQLTQL